MDFRTLSLFTHLARTLHFANTANQMAVSPSTLSRAMQRLEQETGCALFERDNRSVVLTAEGRRLLASAMNCAMISGIHARHCKVGSVYSVPLLPAIFYCRKCWGDSGTVTRNWSSNWKPAMRHWP